jgi:sugar (pentulose or hexulose) kinase
MKQTNYIAVDLGAESGRVMIGSVSNEKITLKEIHRFSNGPVSKGDSLRWDFAQLLSNIKDGIAKAVKHADHPITSIGVDSWGVDFGLIDDKNQLIENPYNYRDSRTNGMMEKALELMPKRELYENTGIQFMQLNTIYQLLSARLSNDPALSKAKKLIFMADLVSFSLTGQVYAEYSLASTSQLMDMKTGNWSKAVFEKLGLPLDIMPNIVAPGTVVGKLTKDIANELGCGQIPVVAVGSHDTACAVAAVPASTENWMYLSSGTWSLMGIEVPRPIINDKSFEYQFTNEGGAENTIRFLKNIMGLWVVQECRRQWQREGTDLTYDHITEMTAHAKPFKAYVDVDYDQFLSPGNMPEKINAYLRQTGQNTLSDKGEIVRAVLEGLAMKYRDVVDIIESLSQKKIDAVHIVGGGIKNELLCQFTADSLNKKVMTGPIEATALGNIMLQAIAAGKIRNIAHGRELIRKSTPIKEYFPKDAVVWQKQYKQFKKR